MQALREQLKAVTCRNGMYVRCIECQFHFPKNMCIPLDSRFKNLMNFFIVIDNSTTTINNINNNTIINYAETPCLDYEQASDPISDFWDDKHIYLDDPELNEAFLLALSWQHADIADLICKMFPDELIYGSSLATQKKPWACFHEHRWKAIGQAGAIVRTIKHKKVRDLFKAAYDRYATLLMQSTHDKTLQRKVKNLREAIKSIQNTGIQQCVIEQAKSYYEEKARTIRGCPRRQSGFAFFDNGVFDLGKWVNGEAEFFRPGHLSVFSTLTVGYDFDIHWLTDEITISKVIACIDMIQPTVECRDFLLTFASMMLSSKAHFAKLVFVTGDGANGKTVIIEALKAILGKYAGTLHSAFFTSRNDQVHDATPALTAIVKSRGVFISEIEPTAKLNTATCKSITGGDTLSYRPMYSEAEKFRPGFAIMLAKTIFLNLLMTLHSPFNAE